MSKPLLYVCFHPSGAGTLREALAQQGRTEQVACSYDDFSFGPIGVDDAARVAWVDEELGFADWDRVAAHTAPFLEASCSANILPVAWVSRRDASSYSGFLWWLSYLGHAPCKIIDVTELTIDNPARPASKRLAITPSALNTEQTSRLLDTAVDLNPFQQEQHRIRWKQLVLEQAPLRVVDQHGSLASAPITHFDDLLLAHATTAWRGMWRIVGEALASFYTDGLNQTGDIILYVRCCMLAETGALEWRGDLSSTQTCEVRLPASVRN